ncbi:terminase large subunit domain-containing protein [Agrobacterium sp. rho-8.1]|nr:terminase family protein [Agrobacterium sp. rho-8.1]
MNLNDEEKKQLEELLISFQNDIELFAIAIWGEENALRPKQIEFCNAFRNNKRITFKGGVGFGKTRSLAILVWWALFTHNDVQITIFGPNQDQLKGGIWNELQSLHGKMRAIWKDNWDVTATRIQRVKDGADCFAEFRLANKDNISAARGIHKTNNFVFVDEATGVPDEVLTVLSNVLSDPNGKYCLISNPSSASGYFWDTWNGHLAPLWTKVHGKMTDSPHVTEEDLYAKEIEYGGKFSRDYRIYVHGEFPLSDTDGLIPRNLVEQAIENEDAKPSERLPIIWGLDPAEGGDRSVLVIRHDNKVLDVHSWRGLETKQLAFKVRDLYQATPKAQRPIAVCVDAIGIGNGVWGDLQYMGLPAKKVIVSSSPTRRPDFYSRLRDQLWWECKEWFATENVCIPNNEDLVMELLLPTYESDSGKIKVEKKSDMKKRSKGASPDHADALCLTFAISPTRYASKYEWKPDVDLRHYE